MRGIYAYCSVQWVAVIASGVATCVAGAGVHAAEESYKEVGARARRADELRAFDIPTQSLDAALLAFSEQADVQVSVATDAITGKRSRAIKGVFTAAGVLALLLENSGLGMRKVGERTYVIVTSVPQEDAQDGMDGIAAMRRGRAGDGAVEAVPVEEVVVTGTHIRDVELVGSPLVAIGRVEIEAAGYSSVQDLLQGLPQSFGGGPNEDTTGVPGADPEAGTNIGRGSSINLRGLGADATLVLVNGRRVAAGGFGEFVDVSMISVAAVERVDVLLDGASALYGADAVGGVVNIVLRKDFEGAETRVRYGGVTEGRSTEVALNQLIGTSWGRGSAMANYSFRKRERLASRDRAFTADSDLRRFGGTNHGSVFSNPGNITDAAMTYAIPAGQDGRGSDGQGLRVEDLLPGERNLQNIRADTDILPQQRQQSLFVTGMQRVSEDVTLFGEGRFGRREFEARGRAAFATLAVPHSNPFYVNPFATPSVLVQYSFGRDLGPTLEGGNVESLGAVAGATVALARAWRAEFAGSYSCEKTGVRADNVVHSGRLAAALADSNPESAFNPFGDGSHTNAATIAAVRGFVRTDNASEVWAVDGKVDGPLFDVASGAVRLAAGGHYREELLARANVLSTSAVEAVELRMPKMRRQVAGVFLEVAAPVTSRLALSLAGRAEDYNDFGTTVNPKIGFRWVPVEGLTLRGTYGRSFKAPGFADLDDSTRAVNLTTVADPTSPTGTTLALVVSGNNADLREETARTWTVGMVVLPASLPGARLSIDYFNVAFDDRIARPPSALSLLVQERDYESLVIRNPDAGAVLALFAEPAFRGVPVDPALVAVVMDTRLRNLASTRVRGIDAAVRYEQESGMGVVSLAVDGSFLQSFEEALTDRSPFVERGGKLGGPVTTRMRGHGELRRGTVSGAVFVNYQDAYRDTVSEPDRRIGSWTTLDVRVGYSRASVGVAVGVENVFDAEPPVVDHVRGVAFDPQNAEPLGRFVSIELTKKW